MTQLAQDPSAGPYLGDGSTVTFSYGFRILAAADLEVTIIDADGLATVQTLTTHYSVSGVGAASGGTITFVTAPASGTSVRMRRTSARTQTLDLVTQGDFDADLIETQLDRATMIAQELDALLDRTFRVPVGDTGGELPSVATRANKFLQFDADGSATVASGVVSDDIAVTGSQATNSLIVATSASAAAWRTLAQFAALMAADAAAIEAIKDAVIADIEGADAEAVVADITGDATALEAIKDAMFGDIDSADVAALNADLFGAAAWTGNLSGVDETALAVANAFDAFTAGGLAYIDSATISSDATVEFDSADFDAATYGSYLFTFANVMPETSGQSLRARTSADGGTSFDSGASDYSHIATFAGGTAGINTESTNASEIIFSEGVSNAAASGGLSGQLWLHNPGAAAFSEMVGDFVTTRSDGTFSRSTSGGRRKSAAAVDGIQFRASSGNLLSGVITMFGVRKS